MISSASSLVIFASLHLDAIAASMTIVVCSIKCSNSNSDYTSYYNCDSMEYVELFAAGMTILLIAQALWAVGCDAA